MMICIASSAVALPRDPDLLPAGAPHKLAPATHGARSNWAGLLLAFSLALGLVGRPTGAEMQRR